MAVTLKPQRDGSWRAYWYGVFEEQGKRRVVNLNVKWRGTPPASGSLRDAGDTAFERSRADAEKALAAYTEEAARKGRADHLTERLIESKTGAPVEYAKLADLPARWRTLGRESRPDARYMAGCDARFTRFIEYMKSRNPTAVFLYEVKPDDAADFLAACQIILSRKTARDISKLLNKAFARFLPVGAVNPFAGLVGHKSNGEAGTVHRQPFTPEELKTLLETARQDAFMHPLIVTASCTGLRRGDVCALPWKSVDLQAGMLAVHTSKTGAKVEIPIFAPLREVLEQRRGNGGKLVFPEAARMLAENPDGLTWRFKKIVAAAFDAPATAAALPSAVDWQDIESKATAAIMESVPDGPRRARMLDILRRYCAGESFREIVRNAGHCKATVSGDLHAIQDLIGIRFMRVQTPSVKAAIRRTTQTNREQGERAASVRDWHTLRATWVTIALMAGVPVELVRLVTGHATTNIILEHYFKPNREQLRRSLAAALPGVLTGAKEPAKLKPADELAGLVAKIQDGSATEKERRRFRVIAAKV